MFFVFSQFPFGKKFKSDLQENNPRDYQLDSFFTVQNRHTYFQRSKEAPRKRHVRLRARQVLCNRCKNICTENGKIVKKLVNKARKGHHNDDQRAKFNDLCVKTSILVPKLKRLEENFIRKFNQKQINEIENRCDDNNKTKSTPFKIKILPDQERFEPKHVTGIVYVYKVLYAKKKCQYSNSHRIFIL